MKENFKLKIKNKNKKAQNIVPTYLTNAVTQQQIYDPSSTLHVPDMANIMDAKAFSEEHEG